MLRCSPTGKSLPGLPGIVTSPGLVGCLYWRWLPRIRMRNQPSSSINLMASRVFTSSPHSPRLIRMLEPIEATRQMTPVVHKP